MANQRLTVFTNILLSFMTITLMEHQLWAQTCTEVGPCRCTMSTGEGIIDISSIGYTDGKARFPNSPSYDGTPYAYNPCYSISIDDCQSASVCKEVNGKFVDQGLQESAQWSFRGHYPIITYTVSNTKTEVMLICNANFTNPQLTVVGALPGGTTGMMLMSKCACPGGCEGVSVPGSSGLSLGSVMVIIFFSLLVVYMLTGSAFNYTKAGKKGKEVIPNYESWSLLFGFIFGRLPIYKKPGMLQKKTRDINPSEEPITLIVCHWKRDLYYCEIKLSELLVIVI